MGRTRVHNSIVDLHCSYCSEVVTRLNAEQSQSLIDNSK